MGDFNQDGTVLGVIVRGIAAGMTGSQEIQEAMARELIELREKLVDLQKPRGADGYTNEDFRAVAGNIAADPRWAVRADSQRVAAWALKQDDEAKLLAANVAALTEDVAKQRAVIAQMRPIYDAANRLAATEHRYSPDCCTDGEHCEAGKCEAELRAEIQRGAR